MSHGPDYRKATNVAYHILASKRIFSLSVNVFSIVENMENCRLLTYGQACFFYGYTLASLMDVSEFGFSIVSACGRQRIILYNENLSLSCIRFTIAHEIGHAVLDHMDENSLWVEKEANCFARNLLCPIPVVYDLKLSSANDYASIFDVSIQMAQVSLDKQKCDLYYIRKELYSEISGKLFAYLNGYDDAGLFYCSHVS